MSNIEIRRGLAPALYFLFALSGVAGLIYESIWSHYLKLFLGHAAYAQTLVLAIFMGGMALGAWAAGEMARRLRQPLMGYILAEIVLGLMGLGFDPMFRGVQAWAFDSAIPALNSPLAIDLLKWGLAALVILPQCVRLGATFPLMSSGLIRLNPQITGGTLSWLYFTNSLGAAAGVLIGGFVLIGLVGLPGTLLTAALLNFLVALGVWMLWARRAGAPEGQRLGEQRADAGVAPRLLLIAAFVTGVASFLYEIGWIRMLSLVLGSATHAFELMLSAFIFGLAMGAYYQRRRIDGYRSPLAVLGWVQVLMAVAALLSLLLYGQSFGWMSTVMQTVQRNESGYVAFNLFSHLLCLALMLPATFFAGMTLPLITAVLIRAGGGDAAIGRVYAANTLGAIVGVMLAVHLVMPLLGLRQVVVLGAALDLLLGLWLLRKARPQWTPSTRLALAASLLIAVTVAMFVRFDASQLASGVFRFGAERTEQQIVFHRDGKTASVDVLLGEDGQMSIATNGKVDAALNPTTATPDDYTMILMGVLPLMLHPEAQQAAVIGFGSGRSTHTLLQYPGLARVDTIEIEPAMVEGARRFGAPVASAYEDPRSHIHIDDAKSYFAREHRSYDLIISEPSNPWVSGVASLFSEEFYARVGGYLAPGGVFLQWLQGYEIDLHLAGSVFNALGRHFSDYRVYGSLDGDFLIVAVPEGRLPEMTAQALQAPALATLAARVGVRHVDDMEALRIGSKTTLAPFFAAIGAKANGDYFPILDQLAVKQRFLRASSEGFATIRPYSARLEGLSPAQQVLSPNHGLSSANLAAAAQALPAYLQGRRLSEGQRDPSGLLARAGQLTASLAQCNPQVILDNWPVMLRDYARDYLPYLTAEAGHALVTILRQHSCHTQLDAQSQQWLTFIEEVSAQRWPQVREIGSSLLPTALGNNALVEMLANHLLLADLLTEGPAAARERLAQWRIPPTTPAFRFLAAQAMFGER